MAVISIRTSIIKITVTSVFSDWLLLIPPVHLQTRDVSRLAGQRMRLSPHRVFAFVSSHQDE